MQVFATEGELGHTCACAHPLHVLPSSLRGTNDLPLCQLLRPLSTVSSLASLFAVTDAVQQLLILPPLILPPLLSCFFHFLPGGLRLFLLSLLDQRRFLRPWVGQSIYQPT